MTKAEAIKSIQVAIAQLRDYRASQDRCEATTEDVIFLLQEVINVLDESLQCNLKCSRYVN